MKDAKIDGFNPPDSVDLFPGEVIGSGTVGTGCLLELNKEQDPRPKPGDIIELEIKVIGISRKK